MLLLLLLLLLGEALLLLALLLLTLIECIDARLHSSQLGLLLGLSLNLLLLQILTTNADATPFTAVTIQARQDKLAPHALHDCSCLVAAVVVVRTAALVCRGSL